MRLVTPLPYETLGSMRGQCWWKGGPENELAFTMGAVKLGPFKIGKDKNDVKTYRFFLNDGKVSPRCDVRFRTAGIGKFYPSMRG